MKKTSSGYKKWYLAGIILLGLGGGVWGLKKFGMLNFFGPQKADMVIFSYDRPLQLFGFLESVETYMEGLSSVSVLYRTTNAQFEKGYQIVKKEYPHVHFYKQTNPPYDFKQKLLQILFKDTKSNYFLTAVEDMIVTDRVDISDCIRLIEKQNAYGFYLRLGTNIDHCYTVNKKCGVPDLKEVEPGVFAWQFDQPGTQGDWMLPVSTDMTVCRKKRVKEAFEKSNYCTPNSFEERWGNTVSRSQIGLCYTYSKNVNIPLNLVQESKWHRSMNFFSTEELLEEFLAGQKIDIQQFAQIRNCAPHMEYLPKLIER